ncbi:hypothetical protein MIMGU_mgv1a019907mg [Erythranthe guttata]|uniref:Uncharacterized protein n=1 Tax=Erythranthe guttata TaxID=4155 RepID=A0A022QRE1_ERYGU|nr:hypothetical protein MIMGU_mgv1a019907mg [Erythranthe guttata]
MARRVKNKNAASIQITAEQILREARELQEAKIRPPKQRITESAELGDYRLEKRKEFEDLIRRVRWNKSVWIKYANWEESQKDFDRARSVWERALEVDYRDHTLWLKYASFEMKNKFIDHARNVWDRATELLPRVDQLWYKYIHMEFMLGNYAGARQIYDRWMNWSPDQEAWLSYIKFELRFNEIERARSIFERFVDCHPNVGAWIRFVKFEMKYGDIARARNCYERAVDKFEGDVEVAKDLFALDHKAIANVPPSHEKRYWKRYIYLWINYALYEELDAQDTDRTRDVYTLCLKTIPHKKFSFAKIWLMAAQFEVRQVNIDRARKILGSAIGMAPKDRIFTKYVEMEMQLGNVERCRKIYEKYLEWAPENCRAWTKFAEFEDSLGETERAEAILEMMPKKKLLKKRSRQMYQTEEDDCPQEEEEMMQRRNFQLLEAAYKWKKNRIGIQ